MKQYTTIESNTNIRCPLTFSSLLFGVILLFASQSGYAGNATWNNNPANGDWNTATNWTPNTVPGGSDIATFNSSNITDITISEDSAIFEILFNPGASSFTYTVSHFDGFDFTIVGIVNNSGVIQRFIAEVDAEGNPGFLTFEGNASAGNQTLCTARRGTVVGGEGALISFLDFASAGEGEFLIEGAAGSGLPGGRAIFFSSSTANNATLTSEGGQAAGAPGGLILLQNQSHADCATLVANGGVNGGGGGEIQFLGSAAGDKARIEVFGNGFLDVSAHGAVAVGSIEGNGLILLAARKLTVGSNGLSTEFSGVMREATGSGGSLAKTGTGTLTLSGASTFTGGATVSLGTLVVTNTTGSATGTGSLLLSAGTLGGSGIIAGAVTVGTGSGSGAFLAPAHGGKKQLTLTIQGSVTFNSDATYTYTFKAKSNRSKIDKVVANGVTINSGAMINLSGTTQGPLTQGTILTLIKNTAATPISGTFSNLPDGGIVNVNGNNLQADYRGGDGNDLTLTVVP